MAKAKLYPELEVPEMLLADRRSAYGLRTYVSLFSSAGVGCYGFMEEGFYCVATNVSAVINTFLIELLNF